MTYQKLFYLKYIKGIPTSELFKRYPDSVERVSQVALCDLPEETLREILTEEDEFLRLMRLKHKFSNLLPS